MFWEESAPHKLLAEKVIVARKNISLLFYHRETLLIRRYQNCVFYNSIPLRDLSSENVFLSDKIKG